MSLQSPVSGAAFEAKYRQSNDPWDFVGSSYENDRYARTLQALASDRYRRVFEPACSIGVLTATLAQRCDEVVATDISPTAVSLARQRCAKLPWVDISCLDLRDHRPSGTFDLIVFSELGYYFPPPILASISLSLGEALDVRGEFVAVHWLGRSEDHLLHGDEVHAILAESLSRSCRSIHSARFPGFRVDTWRRA